MTSHTLIPPHQEYGITDIGDVLSPGVGATDEGFSFQDIEDVLDPPDLDGGTVQNNKPTSRTSLLDLVDGSDVTDSTVSEEDEEDYINCWNPYRKLFSYFYGRRVHYNYCVLISSLSVTAKGANSSLCSL